MTSVNKVGYEMGKKDYFLQYLHIFLLEGYSSAPEKHCNIYYVHDQGSGPLSCSFNDKISYRGALGLDHEEAVRQAMNGVTVVKVIME